jgi:hypothetical protein
MDFCQWLLQQHAVDPGFPSLMFTDEAKFTQDRIISYHNSHVWADENPHITFQSRHQQRFSINLWTDTWGQTDWPLYFAAKVNRAFLSQIHSQHSAGVTARCPCGKNTAVVYA